MKINNAHAKSVKGIALMTALTFLSGCSMLSETFAGSTDKIAELQQQSGSKTDRWLDNDARWKNWDVGNPNNSLVTWSYEKNALAVKLVASRDLNTYAQRPHTLVVKVIQLTDVSGLSTLIQTPDGVRAVLSEATEMIPNAVYSESKILAPKQTQTINFARQQDAKFIALVTGFAELNTEKSVRIIPIPVISEAQTPPEQETSLVDTLTFGFFAEEPEQLPDIVRPALITMDVKLGENSISEFLATAR